MAIPLTGLTQISNGDALDAVPVDGNFDAITSHINTEMIARDGSVAMTGQLSLVGDPSSDSDAARKAYVDAQGTSSVTARFTRGSNYALTSAVRYDVEYELETNDTDGWWSFPGTTLTCPADGIYAVVLYLDTSIPVGGDVDCWLYPSDSEITQQQPESYLLYATQRDNGVFSYPQIDRSLYQLSSGGVFRVNAGNAFKLGVYTPGTATVQDAQVIITRIALL